VPARDRFLDLLRTAVDAGTLVKLTLGKPRGSDPSLRNLFVRPVALKAGPHLAFLWRHAARDVTKNLPPDEAVALLERLLGSDFLDAHLFTTAQNAQFESQPDGSARLKLTAPSAPRVAPAAAHDRPRDYRIPADAPWLRALGVTNDRGQPREGMADKFRQIQKFAELVSHLVAEAFSTPADDAATPLPDSVPAAAPAPLRVVDMGSGKGYLTFALAHVLGARAHVRGIELRRELVDLCNRVARDHGLADRLVFSAGTIADAPVGAGDCDVLIALHACDTATDDALARGVAAGARLLIVSPCCQKELRPQLVAPPVLAGALRHGIFAERQAEFVTDALRAQLLECVGYRTKVFEFISTEHTAKNLMLTATRRLVVAADGADATARRRVRDFAAFYGIRRQRLAEHFALPLASPA
jgi:SAM-dependent methyltransferase